ncbi:MAG TPA: DUF3617 family protein [Nevskiaceae bacterium]|nr:DUF3617 family protein [Nevskiaceae bacterium]
MLGVALALAGECGIAAAAAPGQLVDLTVRVQESMTGMPAIPPRTMHRQACMASTGHFDPHALEQARKTNDCHIEHYQRKGEVVTYDMICTKPEAVTSHGTFHVKSAADFTGTMHTRLTAAGHAISVTTDYTAKPVGSGKATCTPPPAHPTTG